MANAQAVSFDQLLQESRKKRKAEQLAQEIFGKRNRSQTPQGPRGKPAPGASLASRVGVAKPRTASLPRADSNTAATARNNRLPPQQINRPAANDNRAARSTHYQYRAPQIPVSDPVSDVKSNGNAGYDAPPPVAAATLPANANISFRGAAVSQHVVVAQNFAPGTTAADIESVMTDVGGAVVECKLTQETPIVIAEMTFVEKSGAEAVINTFNGKKADGRTLNVFLKAGGGAKLPFVVDVEPAAEEAMEIDENAQAREAEDRRREERRGPADRGPPPPRDDYLTGPRQDRGYRDDYYSRGPRQAEPAYQDGRYGFGGGGGRYGGGGGYRNDGRLGGYGGRHSYRP
ncbi:putative nucleotide-binding alpha-beta plait domain superfamily, RNA-binding domain superfamily [Septoria linicola]|nr:putative nucleotide-binding alpha-beta plait domain superfamily, RNA-binding domain superfamily [Septoria linicola]